MRKIIRCLLVCTWLFAGYIFAAQNTFAQTCYAVWPGISLRWDGLLDNRYVRGGSYFTGQVVETCNACACFKLYTPGESCKAYFDGATSGLCGSESLFGFTYGAEKGKEGEHYAEIKLTVSAHGDDNTVVTPTFERQIIYIDSTRPEQKITAPMDGSVLIPAKALLKLNVTETDVHGSGIGIVSIGFRIGGGCSFKKSFYRSGENSQKIYFKACSSEKFALSLGDCDINIGTRNSFDYEHDFREELNISSSNNCGVWVSLESEDRVGNSTYPGYDKTLEFLIDNTSPTITITIPTIDNGMVGASLNMTWPDPEKPVISGTVGDFLGVEEIWLTIQDDRAGTYWNGVGWQTGEAIVPVTVPTLNPSTGFTEKLGSWKYTKLTKQKLNSGKLTIKAYARDKGGLIGTASISSEYRKRVDFGPNVFAGHTITMKQVKNIARTTDTDTFTTNAREDIIGVTAQITPLRLSGVLNDYVKWSVIGVNEDSGKPQQPNDGNPSMLFLTIPPIPAKPGGRSEPMGYTVFPRVEIDGTVYNGVDHESIYQDNLDMLRQEYVDFGAPMQARLDFDHITVPEYYRRLLDFYNGDIDSSHKSWIVRDLLANAINLKNFYGGELNVTAGYRCPLGNRRAHGAWNSRHLRGTALDYAQKDANQNNDNSENWKVWKASLSLGATEHLLYDQNDCMIRNEFIPQTEYLFSDAATVVCYGVEKKEKQITAYKHGHVAW